MGCLGGHGGPVVQLNLDDVAVGQGLAIGGIARELRFGKALSASGAFLNPKDMGL